MSKGVRPAITRDWGSDDTGCHVLHVDMDCFFASVELLYRPELVGKPLIVGGSGNRGVVTSATYEARAFGVHAAMPIARARRLCPQAEVVPNRKGVYSEVSAKVMDVLSRVSPVIEKVSVDEAFIDVAGSVRRMGSPVEIARWIRATVRKEVGVPASVGVAAVTHVAKLASTFAKPDGYLLIPAAHTVEFLHSLPASTMPGVGQRAAEICERYGLRTVADLVAVPPARLGAWLGRAQAAALRRYAAGDEVRGIHPQRAEKSVSSEETFEHDVTDAEVLGARVVSQSHALARRLRTSGIVGSTVGIKIRFSDFSTITRSTTLSQPTDVGQEIARAALALLEKVSIPPGGIRLVGTKVEQLRPRSAGVQLALDDDGRERAAESVADRIAARFGDDIIGPARLLSGGRHPGGNWDAKDVP
ncbi:hypothetical protein BSZ39_06535 [Bowdeniella nasicola]|uniref:DNA polymerase IV n=1 Tax=Bowdeniella nasicola TaxID=208480 RepID=A0A1Q5Q2D0_9ACTO|nr:DNA polymerase IV [Bowdeniella nasicola]OKL54003.1 hypothetical protein BSZ39_06535 [Bowdeniella nasicola]